MFVIGVVVVDQSDIMIYCSDDVLLFVNDGSYVQVGYVMVCELCLLNFVVGVYDVYFMGLLFYFDFEVFVLQFDDVKIIVVLQ